MIAPRRGIEQAMAPEGPSSVRPPAARGFAASFGLDPRVALLTVLVDLMANSATIASAGLLYEVELGAAVVLTVIAYKAQRAWYGDDRDSALIKALVVGLLTAIPVPISPLFALPGGAIGLLRVLRHRGN
ncbi:MAG: hypothetical protein ABSD02_13720 [Steroidobacteraceae bacterium]|jgi:hypothetical protein